MGTSSYSACTKAADLPNGLPFGRFDLALDSNGSSRCGEPTGRKLMETGTASGRNWDSLD